MKWSDMCCRKLPQASVLGELHDDAEGFVGRGEGAQELRHVRVVERLDDVVLDDEDLHFLRRVVRLEPLDCHPHETVSCNRKVRLESCFTERDRLLKGQEMRWEIPPFVLSSPFLRPFIATSLSSCEVGGIFSSHEDQWSTEAGFCRFGRIWSFGWSMTRSFGRITKLRLFTEASAIYRGFGVLPKLRPSTEADYFKYRMSQSPQ